MCAISGVSLQVRSTVRQYHQRQVYSRNLRPDLRRLSHHYVGDTSTTKVYYGEACLLAESYHEGNDPLYPRSEILVTAFACVATMVVRWPWSWKGWPPTTVLAAIYGWRMPAQMRLLWSSKLMAAGKNCLLRPAQASHELKAPKPERR